MMIKKIFLVVAAANIALIGLLYGVCPDWFVKSWLGQVAPSTDMAHLLRAIMGLYLGIAGFWLFAAFSDQYRNGGLLSAAFLIGLLLLGRVISYIVDGQPSPLLMVFIGMELVFVPVAIWVIRLPESAKTG